MINKVKIREWLQTRFNRERAGNRGEDAAVLQSILEGLEENEVKNKEVQSALAKSELRFRTLFESASDAIFMMQGYVFTDCNSATERIFGCHKNEIVGQTPIFFSPQFQPTGLTSEKAALEKINNALAGKSQFFEWKHKKYDGTLFDAEVSLNKLELDGEVFIQAIVRDISQRKKEQMALADREKRFSKLVHQSPMAVIEWDTELCVLEWNEAAEKMFGYTRAEALGRSAFDLMLRSEKRNEIEHIRKLLISQQGGTRSTNENITKQGDTISCDWYNSWLVDDQGRTTGIISTVEEITAKLKAEKMLQESESKFRQIVQRSPMGIYVYEVNDQNQLILMDTNPAADHLTGIDNAKLRGMTIEDAFPGLKETEVPHHYLMAALQGTPWTNENIQYHEGNINGTFYVSAFQAGFKRMAVMFNNITERIQIENAIRQKNEELIKINAELDRFVYSASHDLRAPIASLLGLLEVARLENDATSLERLLDMQKRSLHKLDDFIQDIVNYSRNKRLKVEAEPVDFQALIEGVFEQLHFVNWLNKMERKISVAPQLNFSGDRKRIEVILSNLISNAIKYADVSKPNPFVEVRVEKSDEGVLILVADNGEGIDELHVPKIFDMFYRATQLSTGSGIGLYIVNEMIQKMNGKIEVRSKKGIGSTFHIYLPTSSIS